MGIPKHRLEKISAAIGMQLFYILKIQVRGRAQRARRKFGPRPKCMGNRKNEVRFAHIFCRTRSGSRSLPQTLHISDLSCPAYQGGSSRAAHPCALGVSFLPFEYLSGLSDLSGDLQASCNPSPLCSLSSSHEIRTKNRQRPD